MYTLRSMNNLLDILAKEGHYSEAEKLGTEIRDIQRRVHGPDDPATASATYNIACLAALQNHPKDALALLREAVDHGLSTGLALQIEKDDDLKSLHGDRRFDALVAHAKARAAAAARPN